MKATGPGHPECVGCDARGISVFCDLDTPALDAITAVKSCATYRRGEVIFRQGAYPTGLYCVHRGKVKIYKVGDEGREQIVRLAREGDILGYRSLLSGEVYSACASPIEEATICHISSAVLLKLLHSSPELSLRMIQLLSHELRQAEHWIMELAQKPVKNRIAESLLVLKRVFGIEADGVTLSVLLTREEIAGIVGTATESVIRLMSDLRREGVIELEGRRIRIVDAEGLARLAGVED